MTLVIRDLFMYSLPKCWWRAPIHAFTFLTVIFYQQILYRVFEHLITCCVYLNQFCQHAALAHIEVGTFAIGVHALED